IILSYLYKNNVSHYKEGFFLGCFFAMLFTVRFFIEFVKENQEAFENTLPINMGQILSIPFIMIGVYLIVSKSVMGTSFIDIRKFKK
ncbi:MAG: prolipoprotein diacylglyceryl transferase family protein, partial [Bacteroidota bacterium]